MAWVHSLRISIVLILMFYIHVIKAPPTMEDRTSIISVFQDSYCQTRRATEETMQVAFSRKCHTILGDFNSVKTMIVAAGCQVTVYARPHCFDATIAAPGDCLNMTIGSYSVDCAGLGSSNVNLVSTRGGLPAVTQATLIHEPLALPAPTSLWSSSFLISVTASVGTTKMSSSPDSGSKQIYAAYSLSSSSPIFSSTASLSTIKRSSSTDRGSNQTYSASSSNPQSTVLSPPSSPIQPPANNKSQSDSISGDNLSKAAVIALAVVIPGVGVIVAVIFGIRGWNLRHPVLLSNDRRKK